MSNPASWQPEDKLRYKLETTPDFKTGGVYPVHANDGEYLTVRFSNHENPARFSINVAAEVFDFVGRHKP